MREGKDRAFAPAVPITKPAVSRTLPSRHKPPIPNRPVWAVPCKRYLAHFRVHQDRAYDFERVSCTWPMGGLGHGSPCKFRQKKAIISVISYVDIIGVQKLAVYVIGRHYTRQKRSMR